MSYSGNAPYYLHPTRYVFNHVPKTGGSSILAICRYNLTEAEISPHLTDDDILLADGRLEQYKLIAGHFSLLAQNRFTRDRYSMTLVREPIQAIRSTYTFWRSVPDLNPFTMKAKSLSFAEFVRYFANAPALIHNRLTHHYAAMGRDWPADEGDSSLLLALAKHNLSAFDFVGICEDFESSARLLCHELGWQLPVPIPHENRSREDNQSPGADGETIRMLQDRNELDLELYSYAVSLFRGRKRNRCCPHSTGSLQMGAVPNLTGDCEKESGREVERNRFVPFPTPLDVARKARIQSVSASWVLDEAPFRLEVVVGFRTEAQLSEMVVGVVLSNSEGKQVWGTNTAVQHLQVKTEKDSEYRVRFWLQFGYPAGRYFITAAVHRLSRTGFHDHWIDRATFFDVEPSTGTYSGINLLGVELVS